METTYFMAFMAALRLIIPVLILILVGEKINRRSTRGIN